VQGCFFQVLIRKIIKSAMLSNDVNAIWDGVIELLDAFNLYNKRKF